ETKRAYPPTIRYLTFRALKMDKSSLKSSNIQRRLVDRISCHRDFRNRAHAFMRRQSLPVPIFIGLHGLPTCVFADYLVHRSVCNTRSGGIAMPPICRMINSLHVP